MFQNFGSLSAACRCYNIDLVAVGGIDRDLAVSSQCCRPADILPVRSKIGTMQQRHRSWPSLAAAAWHTCGAGVQISGVSAYRNQGRYIVAFEHQLPLTGRWFRGRLGAAMLPCLRKDKGADTDHQRYHDDGSEAGQPAFSSCMTTWLPGCWLSTYCIVILRLH